MVRVALFALSLLVIFVHQADSIDTAELIFDEFVDCIGRDKCGLEYVCSIISQPTKIENPDKKDEQEYDSSRYDIFKLKNGLSYELSIQYDYAGTDVIFDEELDGIDSPDNFINQSKPLLVTIDGDKNTILLCGNCITYFYIHRRYEKGITSPLISSLKLFLNKQLLESIKLEQETTMCLNHEECSYSLMMCEKYQTDFFCTNYDNACMNSFAAVTQKAGQCISTCLETYYPAAIPKGSNIDPYACLTAVAPGKDSNSETNLLRNQDIDTDSSHATASHGESITIFIWVIIIVVVLAVVVIAYLIIRQRRLDRNIYVE